MYQIWVGEPQSVAAGGIAEVSSAIAIFVGPITWSFA
jgi:hypothetical protein